MVQINLPENSKVQKGKYYKDKTGSKNIRKVNVYRWDPSSSEKPRIDTYEVDMDNCPSKVLDVLNKIKNEIWYMLDHSFHSYSLHMTHILHERKIFCKQWMDQFHF